jgi:hypothetical protein
MMTRNTVSQAKKSVWIWMACAMSLAIEGPFAAAVKAARTMSAAEVARKAGVKRNRRL